MILPYSWNLMRYVWFRYINIRLDETGSSKNDFHFLNSLFLLSEIVEILEVMRRLLES